MGTGKFNTGDNPAIGWHPIPGGEGGGRTPSCFMPQKPELSTSLVGHLARMHTLPLLMSCHYVMSREPRDCRK